MFFNKRTKNQLYSAKSRLAHLPFIPARSSRYLGALMILGVVSIYALREAYLGSLLGALIFAISFCAVLFISYLSFPLENCLYVDKRGFTYKTLFKTESVDWNEIKNLRFKSVGAVEFVVWDWADNLIQSGQRNRKLCSKITGYSASFINCYEIETKELAIFFELMRDKYAQTWRTPFNNSQPIYNSLDGLRAPAFGRIAR